MARADRYSDDETPIASSVTIAFPAVEVVDGEPSAAIVDRALGLHTSSKRPRLDGRSDSFMSVLSGGAQRTTKKQKNERSPLIEGRPQFGGGGADASTSGGDDEQDPEELDWDEVAALPWYKRPSPLWMLPGTMLMAVSMGMIISPKIEIYYELVCRSIDSNKSGVYLPPPPDTINTSSLVNFFAPSGGGHHEGDWATQCRKSHQVQQAVATLNTVLSLLMGCLAALTSGYWGSLGDRHGRKPIISLAMFGMLVMDIVFLVTVNYHQVLTYYFLLLGPLVDGLLGGYTTAVGAANAYLSDSTKAGSRARVFSVLGGLSYLGIALGPSLGSLIVSWTHHVLAPFYVALTIHSVQLLAVIFIIPESLSKKKQLANRRRHNEAKKAEAELDASQLAVARQQGTGSYLLKRLRMSAARPFRFLRPLKLLLPRQTPDAPEDRSVLERKAKRTNGIDLELFKLAISYAAYIMVMAMMSVKILYTSYKYDWGPQQNGFLLSYVGICRMVVLIVILPLFVKVRRKPAPLPDIPPSDPLYEKEARFLRVVHETHFDLFLARCSVAIEVVGASMMALNGGQVPVFLAATFIASLGSGTSAAIQSLALALSPPRDSGKLFASLSVVQSLASQVVGPLLFGVVFIRGVDADFAEAIFWLGVGLFSLAFLGLSSVRLGVRTSSSPALL